MVKERLGRYLRPAAVVVIILTALALVEYFRHHPEARRQLSDITVTNLSLILLLYGAVMISLWLVQQATLLACRRPIGKRESFLLAAYTALINFFGPLQSGPGVRAVYLRQRYGLSIKQYGLATLFYLGFFGLFSGLFLLSGLIGVGGLAAAGAIAIIMTALAAMVIRWRPKWRARLGWKRFQAMNWRGIGWLAAATWLQVCLTALIYFTELKSVNPGIHFDQAVVYTGAANFALFVSFTPAAIGFRESFLLFATQLHHIDKSTVLAASLVDRAVYVVFLSLLFVVMLGLQARSILFGRLKAEPPRKSYSKSKA